MKKVQTKGPPLESILNEVATIFRCTPAMVKSSSQKQKYVICRRIMSYVATEITNASLTSIGVFLCYKDHTTVINHRDNVKSWMDIEDPVFLAEWEWYISNSEIWEQFKNK